MGADKKVDHLVVDTSAFIQNAALQEIGVNILTEENVISEITNKRQLKRLVVLPYDLQVKQAFPEDIKIVTEFAKKTGDYASLSATDIKVIALTYRLHIENIGKDTIKHEPETITVGDIKAEYEQHPPNTAGFYAPGSQNARSKRHSERKAKALKTLEEKLAQRVNEIRLQLNDAGEEISEFNTEEQDEVELKLSRNDEKISEILCNILLQKCNEDESEDDSYDEDDDEDEDEDDDEGWITPQNIKKVKTEMLAEVVEDTSAVVACLTTDFAMQNVLKQMGMHVVSLDGKVIKQLRTFILRCYACFKTTSNMTKVFCPHCGMKTLKKVSIALNENGEPQMFINFNKPLTSRGKRFSLPTPKGGKHSNNPILREDQPVPDQRASKLARQKNNPLNDDWIAGYSPFVTRDITSRSAMLGIHAGSEVKYWMRKNPNEVKRRGSKKK